SDLSSANYTTDLHSLGQYVQEGRRFLFETVVKVNEPKHSITIEEDSDNLDGLNYLAGKTIDEVNTKAFEGTLLAHTDGGVPNVVDRKSTRLNSSHVSISYAVFCLK